MERTNGGSVPGIVIALIATIGCGGGGAEEPDATSGVPDGGAIDAAAEPDGAVAGDMTPPQIIASDPVDGAHPVSVLADVVITFDEPLDPATATAPGVTLSIAGTITPLRGTVTYDAAAHAITFHATEALAWNSKYVLTLTGIADPSGNTMARATIGFHTYRNHVLRIITYVQGGPVWNWIGYELDADGDPTATANHSNDPGPDGVPLTDDDPITSRSTFEYDANKWLVRTIYYTNAGPDGVWRTHDDHVWGHKDQSYDADGRLLLTNSYKDPGADGVWLTTDDVPTQSEACEYDATGSLSRRITYLGPGADGVWLTPDDDVWHYSVQTNDALGRPILQRRYQYAGPDAMWLTPDDQASEGIAPVYDADGRLASESRAHGPGADGAWLTPDDDFYQIILLAYDGAGSFVHSYIYGDPGGDLTWYTADDTLQSQSAASDPFSKNLYGRSTFSSGPGVVYQRADHAYDAEGNRVSHTFYNSAGPNGVWFDTDDLRNGEWQYDTTR